MAKRGRKKTEAEVFAAIEGGTALRSTRRRTRQQQREQQTSVPTSTPAVSRNSSQAASRKKAPPANQSKNATKKNRRNKRKPSNKITPIRNPYKKAGNKSAAVADVSVPVHASTNAAARPVRAPTTTATALPSRAQTITATRPVRALTTTVALPSQAPTTLSIEAQSTNVGAAPTRFESNGQSIPAAAPAAAPAGGVGGVMAAAINGVINEQATTASFVNLLPAELNMEMILLTLENNKTIFGSAEATEMFLNLSTNTPDYDRDKYGLETRLFGVLGVHPDFKGLCAMIPDPSEPLRQTIIRVFYVLLRGAKTDSKKKLLNYCLLLFSTTLFMKQYDMAFVHESHENFCAAQYQPNASSKMLRMLFSVFRERGIVFSQTHDFNFPGMYVVPFCFIECLPLD
jgi:hypothetical protein